MLGLIARGHRRRLLLALLLTSAFATGPARAQEWDGWSIEPSLYLFLAGLTGTVGIGPFDFDLSNPSDAIWHINFGAMGSVRIAYGPWALTAEALYADLGATKGNLSGSVQELIVEPTVSYRLNSWLEPLAGVRYDRAGADADGPLGHSHAVTQGWVDPIVGAHLRAQVSETVSIDFRGDVGGFSIGSKLTWQAFPYVTWRVAKILSLQAGYRVLSIDYESGSGTERVKFDVIELGPQLGVTFHIDL
jgi:hypothetical protein